MRTVLAAVMALTMSAGGAMAATQFDLACTGSKVGNPTAGSPPEAPWQEHYRVDLLFGEFCTGDCDKPQILIFARPDILVFEDQEDAVTKDVTMVSRETGQVFSTHQSKISPDGWTIRGTCEPAAFSGIPTVVH